LPLKIHFSVFSAGVGHATRAALIARELSRRGFTTTFTASNEAADFLRREGYQVTSVPMVDVGWGEEGGVSIRRTARNVLKSPRPFATQIATEREAMRRADLVISDSKLSPLIAARLSSKPCLLITNQVMLTLPSSARKMKTSLVEKAAGFLSSSAWALADQVVVPDLPPPYSISYLNLMHPLGARISTYIGPILDLDSVNAEMREEVSRLFEIDDSRPVVFIQAAGNTWARSALTELTRQAAPKLSKSYHIILAEGNPMGSHQPERTNWGWRIEWCPYPETLMSLSALVVSRAGHTTISKALALGKPLVLIPIRNHSEQLGNANQVERLGVGRSLGDGTVTPEELEEAINEVVENGRYRSNAERMASLIGRMKPLDTLAQMVEALRARQTTVHPQHPWERQGN
jgi:UDP-N-acetylglucosamine--N-acetylmuramyl-(pentapeptide) pyrophosphoryl-undecaprenol N-acetylglucosamine transferase